MILLVSVILFNILGGLTASTVQSEYNPMENPDLLEGDIETDGDDNDRSAIVQKQLLWTKGVVPYVLDSKLATSVKHKTVLTAIKEFNNRTCMRFIPRTNQKDYVRFITGTGCHTRVGRQGGEHNITLGLGCDLVGSVMHEIGHAIGFYHEHNRSDRHKHIKVIWENIREGKEGQFKQRAPGTDLLLSPFDLDSIMLYGSYFFSKEPKKLKTMVGLKNEILPDVRRRLHLTSVDVYRIRKLYSCVN